MSLTIEERQLIELRIRNDAPNVVVAYVLWGFLGILSAHRFYLGRPRSAALQILSWLTVIGGLVWWLFDAAMISAYIRDDKAALRTRLIEEMEAEKRGAPIPMRPAPAPPPAARPPAAKLPASPPESTTPLAEAAAIPLAAKPAVAIERPAKVALQSELILDGKARQPLTLDEAPLTLKRAPFSLGDEPKAETAIAPLSSVQDPSSGDGWTMAERPAAAAEPAPAVDAGPAIPHPESVDASPIEVFPRPQQPIDSLTDLNEALERVERASPTLTNPGSSAG